ncbi:MAG TPA: sialate O-acetylesterase [Chitinophagaceae bacterium]|nr:sialate O-acetylesterase [Chitinophagaceae bacterium]
MRVFFIAILFYPIFSIGQLKITDVFSSNMLLQREQPIPIWGKAVPGTIVEIKFGKTIRSVVAAKDSTWKAYLPKQRANSQPQSLTIQNGDTAVQFQNIIIGDIWVCIGQSNMEWPMIKEQHWKDEIHNSNQPNIRLLNPPPVGRGVFGVPYTDSLINRLTTERFYDWNGWQQCDSNSVKQMSAVAYYFAKKVSAETGAPIGIINLSIGGAPLTSFINTKTLMHDITFRKNVNNNWLTNDALPVWPRERGKQNVGNNKVPGDENGPNHAYKPGFAYEAGIKPLLQMPVKGLLCYQGESNAQEIEQVNEYAALSKLMIDDYRKKWQQPHLPFYFVQLSSIDTAKYKGHLWPEFRNEQRKMIQLIPYSGMAVCSDIGAKDDVHPTNKKDVGERLARWALRKTYMQNIIPSGPLPVKATYSYGKVIVSFEYMAKGLITSDGKSIKGFSIDGKNETEASFGDSGIIISVNSKPKYIYYGWKPFSNGNLINSENLPASTFKIKVK